MLYQSLLQVCSHPYVSPDEEDQLVASKEVTVRSYYELVSKAASSKQDFFDQLVQSTMTMIQKLNFGTEAVVTSETARPHVDLEVTQDSLDQTNTSGSVQTHERKGFIFVHGVIFQALFRWENGTFSLEGAP